MIKRSEVPKVSEIRTLKGQTVTMVDVCAKDCQLCIEIALRGRCRSKADTQAARRAIRAALRSLRQSAGVGK